jgi:cytochrome P450
MVATVPHAAELGSPQFITDPYPTYAQLRSTTPVFWHADWQGWVVCRHADVQAVLHDARRFSNAGRQVHLLQRLPAETRTALQPLEQHYTQGGLSNQDPPNHTRLRGLISKALTPTRVEAQRPRIQALIDGLLDPLEGAPGFDLIGALAYPLPALVIAHLLGLPPEDCDQFKQWSDELTAFLGQAHASAESAAQGQASLLALRGYLASQVARRRVEPGDDLISGLLSAEERGEGLSEGELLGTCVTLLLGGHETTTNLIGNGVLALLRHPEQWQRLGEPALLPGAVDEVLRYDGPVQRAWRVAAEATELGGQRLERGDLVFALLGAANRDPDQFAAPDRLDVGRPAARHLTFGYGIHFCLGAPLARLEGALALGALRRRWPELHLAPDYVPEWKANIAFRGLKSLPVLCD